MAPARASVRRAQHDQNAIPRPSASDNNADIIVNDELFLEPMMGTPLQMYIEKDVEGRDALVDLINKHGGIVSPGYSGVPYILVDPHKESGQNLYRQYAGKKGKIVLNARWVHECVKSGVLQTFHSNWAGCKVDGSEVVGSNNMQNTLSISTQNQGRSAQTRPSVQAPPVDPCQLPPQQSLLTHPQQLQPGIPSIDPLVHPQFQYHVYAPSLHPGARALQPAPPAQSWQGASGIAPAQTAHLIGRPPLAYREETPWDPTYEHAVPPASTLVGGPAAPGYEYRYREDQPPEWVGNEYYPTYGQSYEHSGYMHDPGSSQNAAPTTIHTEPTDKGRGRKRTRTQPAPAPSASALVMNRHHPPARSPTPPTRVVKSTYGGNLFTADDVHYLKKYIDYCQDQGLVLSLREICERIAVKAPHHTFYSWRRYCNKHQIRLGGYTMNTDRSPTPQQGAEQEPEDDENVLGAGTSMGTLTVQQPDPNEIDQIRNRSPTPPKALFRSTTGKGVAFTDEDVNFLTRFMEYRKSQGRLDMVAFWKDVAIKAPHHSRASWMKFWRRHKHELNRNDGDDPIPHPPEKKMRYSREDDILLAKYFFNKPEGTSDRIFQSFGRINPHHPWKGWQEHHRIHKAKIDHFIQQLANGENIDIAEPSAE